MRLLGAENKKMGYSSKNKISQWVRTSKHIIWGGMREHGKDL